MSSVAEHDLLDKLRDPDQFESGFSLLVKKYSEQMYWQIRKIVITHEDADDVLQQVFIKVFKGFKNFKGDSKLSTWLYRICYNESMTHLKKKSRQLQLSDGEMLQRLTENLEADVYFTGDKIQIELQKALAQLPDRQREVFNMRYFDDLKFQEIAEILNLTEGAVKSSYHHAANKVKEFITSN